MMTTAETLDHRIDRVLEQIIRTIGGMPPTEQYIIRNILSEEFGEIIAVTVRKVHEANR